jgi:molybdopterin molybdotransferase
MNMPANGCDQPGDNLLSYQAALTKLLDFARPVTEFETVPLLQALHRVLAQPVRSRIDVPPADNSSMDGYAIRCADVARSGKTRLGVKQRIAAGSTGQQLEPGQAARIFTGAVVPPGADAVVMQEQVSVNGEEIEFEVKPRRGENIRVAGEDIQRDHVILRQGHRLKAQDLGLAASIGIGELALKRRLKVGIFFTGDELVEPGQALPPGKIYDSNRFTLNGLLQSLGCEIVDLGIVGDTLEQTREAILEATRTTDLVITSGGVSVGEEDHVRIALEQLGQLHMWRLGIKPGKPLAFGRVNDTAFIGLPGNPVSVFATFCLFVAPYIKKCQGRSRYLNHPLSMRCAFDWPRPDKRREFVRVRQLVEETEERSVSLYPNQGSGVLTSASWADGFIEIPENTPVRTGDRLNYYSFAEILS